jgi:hypothetical protein
MLHKRRITFVVLFVLGVGLFGVGLIGHGSAVAQQKDAVPGAKGDEFPARIAPPTDKELADKRMVFMKTALARYTVQVGDQKDPAKVADPCLRWTNPIGTAPDGVVAVYAHNGGRPAAVAQFFMNGQKKWVNEFTIVADGDVTIMRTGKLFWKPTEFVCKFTDLPHSPVPAAKPVLRMAQMRAIAADFSTIDYFGSNKVKENLRLLAQPVYRYSEEGKILDGGLFVFVLGTDPECCLLLEAYQDDKSARYRYAVAPMSIFALKARYKDTPVWSIDRRMLFGKDCRSYYAGGYLPEPGETVPE